MQITEANKVEPFHYILRTSLSYVGIKIVVSILTAVFLNIVSSIALIWLGHTLKIDLPIWPTFLFYLIGLLLATVAIIDYFVVTYEISDEEIVVRRGIFNISEKRFSINNIERVQVYESLLGRMLNYGDILINNLISDEDINIYNVPNPSFYGEKVFSTVKDDGVIEMVRDKPRNIRAFLNKMQSLRKTEVT